MATGGIDETLSDEEAIQLAIQLSLQEHIERSDDNNNPPGST